MKFNSANSSFKLFCRGVPVINSLPQEIKEWTIAKGWNGRSGEGDDVEVRSPLFELARPILGRRFGNDD
jgi:hypothetical protein